MFRSATYLFCCAIALAGTMDLRAQVLVDDFNRANDPVVGGGWSEGGGQRGEINTNRLRFITGSVTDREWVYRDMSAAYNIPFDISTCALEWSFNMRQSRADPSGFDNGNYGVAFVLGGSNGDFNTGQGYAVALGNAGATDPLRIVRYNGGLDGNAQLTNVVSATVAPFSDLGNEYVAVRVVYTPSSSLWELFGETITLATFGTFDPTTVATLVGNGTDNTYTSTTLPYMGAYWNHNTAAGDAALFDNVNAPVSCPTIAPTVNFSSGGAVVLENVGTVDATLNIFPPSAVPGTITVTIVNGPGAVYGSDYTTVPDGSGGSITLNLAAGQSTVTIPITLIDDLVVEDTETVTFTITGTTGGITIGSANPVFTLVIGDNDSPPTVLQRGDLAIVAINANNGPCSGVSAEDEVSFFCFRDITAGTTLDLTDNGYERCNPGQWSDNEGTIRITRTGPVIPAGTVITLRISGAGSITGVSPDGLWGQTILSASPFLNLNSNGDQLFFMQGGAWVDPPGTHNATYVGGDYLYAFSTNGLWLSGQCATADANSHSGLPPQMECFSMEPTSATDWAKYTGPTTATNQRGWLIRIGDATNWTSYASCAAYNGASPNYAGGYTFNITTIGFTPGLWTGGVSTDWFDCRNWSDARIPVATDNVLIDQTAIRNCVVGINPGAAAQCATLLQSNSGTVRQLTVQNSSSLQIGGPLRIERLIAGGTLTTTVTGTSTLSATSVEIMGQTPGVNEAVLRCEQAGNQVLVEGGLTIMQGGLLDLQGTGEGGLLELGGDFVNENDEAAFQENFSTVRLAGNGAQSITTFTGAEVFNNLVVDKPGGDVTLNAPVEVRTLLDLSIGRVLTSAANMLTVRSGADAINASDASHVDGPMRKTGNADFLFPVGKNGLLRPCSVSAVTGGTGTTFEVEYHYDNPRTTFNNVLEPTLDHISACEYWMIDRVAGTGNAVVHLTWREPQSCGVTVLSDLRVARWDGTLWLNRGNGGTTGTVLGGSIATAAVQTVFSPWTLASVTTENPLPIGLIAFSARPEGEQVRLEWTTASERDNAFFTVERSADAAHFHALFTVPGALNSYGPLHYSEFDPYPLRGLSYYRLRQTDTDGTSTVGPAVPVWFGNGGRPLAVHASEGLLTLFHGFPEGASLLVFDMAGRIVADGRIAQAEVATFALGGLPKGAYLLRVQDEERIEAVRFVY